MRRLFALIAVILLCGGFTLSGVCLPVRSMGNNSVSAVADALEEERITRFLLLGCDKSTKLTDSIMLVTVNETKKDANILQIPRDTYAEFTAKDYKKLNGAMSELGPKKLKRFLSDAIGVPIDFFVILKLDFFDDLVDAIGGVDIEIPEDMHYADPSQGLTIDLFQGRAHLNGREAEHFVRYRSGYVDADLGRLNAQKLFLKAFAEQCKSLSLFSLLRVTCLALTGLQTDIGIHDAIRVVRVLRECSTEELKMQTLAGQAVQGNSGAWYYAVNKEGASRQIKELLLPSPKMGEIRFDPKGVFDREGHPDFHKIYTAKEMELPILLS